MGGNITRYINVSLVVLVICSITSPADTFRNRASDEVFHGFLTQKTGQGKTLVYCDEEKKFRPVNLGEYEISMDAKGRRETVVVVAIKQEQVMLSHAVSEMVAKSIIEASNKGPRFIMVEIDCPGGRGDYMKEISTAITQTTNCPVVAFISGGTYGGAYSAAATVAMACDKIYMSADSAMGTIAPTVGRAASGAGGYNDTFSSRNLSGYKNYIGALAGRHYRPEVVAMALLDSNIEVVEVVDAKGTRSFIDRANLRPNQTVVRGLTNSRSVPGGTNGGAGGTDISTAPTGYGVNPGGGSANMMVLRELSLSARDAAAMRMADKVVDSREQILADMGASEAKFIYSSAVEKLVKLFVVAQRNLETSTSTIAYLDNRRVQLQNKLLEIEEKNLNNRPTTSTSARRSNDRLSDRDGLTDYERERLYRDGFVGTIDPRRGNSGAIRVEATEPIDPTIVLAEISDVIANSFREYRKAIGIGRRYPGAFPAGTTLRSLEQGLNWVEASRNEIARRYNLGVVMPYYR